MKDDEPFNGIIAVMERVELPNGRSSLFVSHEIDGLSILRSVVCAGLSAERRI